MDKHINFTFKSWCEGNCDKVADKSEKIDVKKSPQSQTSYYKNTFNEQNCIGRGDFGQVFSSKE